MPRAVVRMTMAVVVVGGTLALWAAPAWAANCSDFTSQAAAQQHLRNDPSDPDGLDRDGDGIACESNPAPKDLNPVVRTTATTTPTTPTTVQPTATTVPGVTQPVAVAVPAGADRFNCSDFQSQQQAQAVLDQDRSDPNRIDADNDGIACEDLPSVSLVHAVGLSQGSVVTNVAGTSVSGLPVTGLNETYQLVELALVLLGLGTALVVGRRPGVIR